MHIICPYYEGNRCTSKYLLQLELKGTIIPFCETQRYNECPVYTASKKMKEEEEEEEEEEKGKDNSQQGST